MNKMMAIFRSQGILILFGFVMTISLFLGDGKQPLIDVVWAFEIVLLYAIYYLQNRKIRALPRTLEAAWILLLGYCIVRTIFSDSVGYSISTLIRLFDAYLIYRLFYSLSDKKYTGYVYLGIISTGVIATAASFVFLLIPRYIQWLPQMNLLYATYGHNQLAGLLLFSIPLVVGEGVSLPTWCKKTILLLFLAGTVISFARGAWILLAAYFAVLLVTKQLSGKLSRSLVIVFMSVVAGLLVSMSLLAPRLAHTPSTLNNAWTYKQIVKAPIYENRIQYWAQALRAISERPVFGGGPGTFYLQSKRLQESPSSYSWFAHSFVLEQFVEVGLIGMMAWVVLFFLQWRLAAPLRTHPLFIGVVLTFLYSLYEYNLNFLVIWLLFWASLGWLIGSTQPKKTERGRFPFSILICVAFLFLFSTLSIGASVETARDNIDAASLFTPFIADVVKTSIEKHTETLTPISQNRLLFLLFFHRTNPDVLHAAAKYYTAINQPKLALRWYESAATQDPKNLSYQQEYLRFVIQNSDPSHNGVVLKQMSLRALPNHLNKEINTIPFTSPDLVPVWSSINLSAIESNPTDLYFAKLYYLLGERMLDKNILLTKQLWTLAKDIYPNMGLLYHELASLEFYSFHDLDAAQKIITECMKVPHAALHCKQLKPRLENVPLPGYVAQDVLEYQ